MPESVIVLPGSSLPLNVLAPPKVGASAAAVAVTVSCGAEVVLPPSLELTVSVSVAVSALPSGACSERLPPVTSASETTLPFVMVLPPLAVDQRPEIGGIPVIVAPLRVSSLSTELTVMRERDRVAGFLVAAERAGAAKGRRLRGGGGGEV